MKPSSVEDEGVMRKLDSLMKDPDKWKEYIACHAERALKHWRKGKRNPKAEVDTRTTEGTGNSPFRSRGIVSQVLAN